MAVDKRTYFCLLVLLAGGNCIDYAVAATGHDGSILSGVFATEPWSRDRELETPALNKWLEGARGTTVGDQLVNVLDNTNAALQYNATDSDALYRRAYLYGMIGCPRMAINDLNKAIGQDPSQSAYHRERGTCYVDMQSYEKGLLDLNQAVNLNPTSGDARLARARLLIQLGKPQQALDDLLVCHRGNVEFKTVLPGELSANQYNTVEYYLGACYEALGRKHEAIQHYRNSLFVDTINIAPGAYVHRYAEQPTDAAECIKRLQGF